MGYTPRTTDERNACDKYFPLLEELLKRTPLPSKDGERIASVDEFMLMSYGSHEAAFKHCDTRQYVYLRNNKLSWEPTSTFDCFEIPFELLE